MSWGHIVGHEKVKLFLRRSLMQDRVSHAYIFTGPVGVGKFKTAMTFAQTMLCADGEKGDPCLACTHCRQMVGSFHPDVHRLTPTDGSLRIDQIRQLSQHLSLKPYVAERKVAVIDEAHTLTVQAQNALLKLLEEPPDGTTLVMVTHLAGALLPTITSRCQIVRFRAVPTKLIARHFEVEGMSKEKATVLAELSQGSIGGALKASEEGFLPLRDRTAVWVDQLSSPEREGLRAVVTIGQELDDDRDRIDDILHLLALWLRDVMLVGEGITDGLANVDCIDELKRQRDKLRRADVVGAIEAVDRARRRLRLRANFRLTVDAMLTDIKRSFSP